MESNECEQKHLCACGCGRETDRDRRGKYNRYILGHNAKHSNDNSALKNGRPGQFQSGNTFGQGRPVGSKNTVTVAAENIIQGEGEALSRKLIELALAGNVACLKTAIERIVPVCKSRPISLPDMPKIDSVADASELTAYVIDAIADGTVTPVEGEIISRACERHLKALEVRDLEARLSALEVKLAANQG
jgi:hypothetical protein